MCNRAHTIAVVAIACVSVSIQQFLCTPHIRLRIDSLYCIDCNECVELVQRTDVRAMRVLHALVSYDIQTIFSNASENLFSHFIAHFRPDLWRSQKKRILCGQSWWSQWYFLFQFTFFFCFCFCFSFSDCDNTPNAIVNFLRVSGEHSKIFLRKKKTFYYQLVHSYDLWAHASWRIVEGISIDLHIFVRRNIGKSYVSKILPPRKLSPHSNEKFAFMCETAYTPSRGK